jgi:MoaA/NifB/PqqE/SkfB family radical SAM enzyme
MLNKKIIKIKTPKKEFFIYWVITDMCNQSCSYCPDFLHNGKYANSTTPSNDDIDIFLSKLIDISKSYDTKLNLTISGGEPTLHDYLPIIIDKMKPYAEINFITNGTRNISWWKNLKHLPDYVTISIHPEYYDNKKFRINDLANFLNNNQVELAFNLMCLSSKWDIMLSILDDLEDKFKPLVVPKIIQDMKTFDRPLLFYTHDQLNFIRTYPTKIVSNKQRPIVTYSDNSTSTLPNPNRLMANDQHHFKDWKCSAGVDSISVHPDGVVKAGICGSYILGNITDFDLKKEYIDCPRPSCTCPGDVHLDKYKYKY